MFIFVNNAIYGMTGGQMATTTLPNQKTQISPYGKDVSVVGSPISIREMLSTLNGVTYAERVATYDFPSVWRTKAAIKKAFELQINNQGFSIIEILSICPTNWGLTPVQSLSWLKENMISHYPLGVFKDTTKEQSEEASI